MKAIRMLNLGPTNWLRTQSVYRSTARLLPEQGHDTIVMSTPLHAYVAVGGGLSPQNAVDVQACVRLDVPLISSSLSQLVTYLDGMALVSQWVFAAQDSGPLLDALLAGALDVLRGLGLAQVARSDDNLLVGDRVLLQTQTGRVAEAMVVQADMFFSMDWQQVLQISSQMHRTTLWAEIARPVSPEMVHMLLIDAFSRQMERPIERGKPAQAETKISKQIDLELLEEAAGLLGTQVKLVARH